MELILTSQQNDIHNFDFIVDGVKIGWAQIKTVTFDGNNIYYEILEQYRGKGHGSTLLKLVLGKAYKLGMRQISILCEKDNLASRTILDRVCGTGNEIIRYVYEL